MSTNTVVSQLQAKEKELIASIRNCKNDDVRKQELLNELEKLKSEICQQIQLIKQEANLLMKQRVKELLSKN